MGWFDRLLGRTEPQPQVVTVVEALPGAYDPDADLSATQGGSPYMRRLSQRGERDFDPLKQERMQRLAFYLYDHNYLGKRVLELVRDFVVGEGITVVSQAKDETAKAAEQDVIDRCWTDPYHRLDLAVHDYCLDLGLWGELVITAAVNETDGSVRFGYIDPGRIDGIVTDPKDDQRVVAVALTRPNPGDPPQRLRVIHAEEDVALPSYGRLVGLAPGETFQEGETSYPYLGSCFYFKVNATRGAKRGRSDLLCIADIIDAHDQALFNAVERNYLTKSFAFDVTVDGDEAMVNKIKGELEGKSPPAGATRVHNAQVTWAAVAPDLKIPDDVALLDAITDAVAVGGGISKTWLSGTMDVNKATAGALDEPAIKRLTARQRYFRYCLEQLVTFVLDQAELAAVLPTRKPPSTKTLRPTPWAFELQFPDMRGKDIAQAATALNQAANALALLKSEAAIDQGTEQRATQVLLGQIGVEYDLETVAANAEQEKEQRKAEMAIAPYPAASPDNGQVAGQQPPPAQNGRPARAQKETTA